MYAILYMQKWLSKSIDPISHPLSNSYSYVTNMNHPYFFLTITIVDVFNDTGEIGP